MDIREKIAEAGSYCFVSLSTAAVFLLLLDFFQNPKLSGLPVLVSTIVFIYPARFIYNNADELESAISSFISDNYIKIVLAVPLFLISTFFFYLGLGNPVIDLINFSFAVSARLFSELLYFQVPLDTLGGFFYDFIRVYFHFIWVYTVLEIFVTVLEGLKDLKS